MINWQVDARNKWRNLCNIEVDGQHYQLEWIPRRWEHTILVHTNMLDVGETPYSESLVGIIEFGHTSENFSVFEYVVIQKPFSFEESVYTDILLSNGNGCTSSFGDHIRQLLAFRSARIQRESMEFEERLKNDGTKLPYE